MTVHTLSGPGQKQRTQLPAKTKFLVSVAVILCFCACSTPYKPAKGAKGYSDSQISTDEFEVGFQGNSRTTLEDVYDFALLRSAEVSLQHGCPYFAVMDAANTSSAKSYIAHQRYYAGAAADTSWGMYRPSGYIVDVREPRVDFQPGTLLKIKGFTEKPTKPFTYDAAELKHTLRQKHKLGS